MEAINIAFDQYIITTNKSLMQPYQIHKWLAENSYWATNIPYETVKTSFDNSFCIGVLYNGIQIGYARLVTDYVVFGYLADVFVVEGHRGKGLSKKMMETIFGLEWVKHLRRINLATRDAHTLYEKVGFSSLQNPERHMEIVRSGIYMQ